MHGLDMQLMILLYISLYLLFFYFFFLSWGYNRPPLEGYSCPPQMSFSVDYVAVYDCPPLAFIFNA